MQNVSKIQPKANEYLEFTMNFKNLSYLTLNNMFKVVFSPFCFDFQMLTFSIPSDHTYLALQSQICSCPCPGTKGQQECPISMETLITNMLLSQSKRKLVSNLSYFPLW